MKRITFTMLPHLVLALKFCTIFYLILGSEKSSGADLQYEACLPKDCGSGLNISFPFYIPNLQDSSCGYPGSEIICSYRHPMLHLPESYYVVEQIFYHNQSVHVYNAAVSTSDIITTCDIIESKKKSSLPSGELQLEYATVTDLYLFSKCNVSNTSENLGHVYACMEFSAALFEGDERLSVALKYCATNVVAPVEMLPQDVRSNTGLEDYGGMLRKRFVLNWRESDCSSCKQSGGHCGFDADFRCFCRDRPHAKMCNDSDFDLQMTAASPKAALQTGAPPPLLHKEIKGETIFSLPLEKGVMIIGVVGVIGVAVILATVCLFIFILRKYQSKDITNQRNETKLNST